MKQEWIVTDLETGKVLKKWIVNPAKGGKKSGKTKRAKKKKLLPPILALLVLTIYGVSASANTFEIQNTSVQNDTPYLTERREPELRGVKNQVLAMLAEEGIDTEKAERIIHCESNWNPQAVNLNRNGSNDMGLWQLNSVHKLSDEVRLDPIESTKFAIRLIKQKGFQPWVCAN